MDQNKICLLVHTGDRNSWVWDAWYEQFNKFDVKIPTVFLSENKPLDKPGVIQELTGNTPWSDGLIDYLLRCPYEYVAYHHEDYFIKGYDHAKIDRVVALMDEHRMECMRICGSWMGFQDEENPHTKTNIETGFEGDDNEKYLWLYNNKARYTVSHQSSIWRSDFLLSTLYRNESGWDHEICGSERLQLRNVPIYGYRGVPPIEYDETVNRGKIRPGCHHYFTNEICNQYS